MKTLSIAKTKLLPMILLAVFCLRPGEVSAVDACSEGIGIPPFLSSGADPNLLLMLDNSGSMLDVAYLQKEWKDSDGDGVSELEVRQCFDDGYGKKVTEGGTVEDVASYAGYFKETIWYQYDTTTQRFEEAADSTVCNGILSQKAGTVCVAIDESSGVVTSFAAIGNFVNWAASSKFDMEKKILTGGKYEPDPDDNTTTDDQRLVMESRGCGGNRFIKEITLDNGEVLSLAIRPPREEKWPQAIEGNSYLAGAIVSDAAGKLFHNFSSASADWSNPVNGASWASVLPWTNNQDWDPDTVVTYGGEIYRCTALVLNNPTPPAPSIDTAHWAMIHQPGRWYSGESYSKGDVVFDVATNKMYEAAGGGTSLSTAATLAADTNIDWFEYNLTHIEIFDLKESGSVTDPPFDYEACEEITNVFLNPTGQSNIDAKLCACVNCEEENPLAHYAVALTHGLHNCWYDAKHEVWPPGMGPIQDIQPACEDLYLAPDGIAPALIDSGSWAHVCYGDSSTGEGYVGRCFEPTVCDSFHPKTGACQKYSSGGWTSDTCIDSALRDYCGVAKVNEVIDPSDQASTTSDFWNLPGLLLDAGIEGQLGSPLLVMKGYVQYEIPGEQDGDAAYKPNGPRGILYDVASDLRLGIMAFNDNGSGSECGVNVSPNIEQYCPDSDVNKDGAKILAPIKLGMYRVDDNIENWDHYNDIITAINGTKATSWTPLAEAMYTALGYYGQKTGVASSSGYKLDTADYQADSESDDAKWDDPVQYWCQENHILFITEGASTADINSVVQTYATLNSDTISGSDDSSTCNDLNASTYLDDLTYFGQNATVEGDSTTASNLYTNLIETNNTAPEPAFAKQNITTHVVTTGSPRTEGTGECSPATIMQEAATNGGTSLYTGENPDQLERNLRAALSDILSRASAGSAASVISSSRSGEGGVYQAIFWPEQSRGVGKGSLDWTGDVHAFFIDENGFLWDDYSGGDLDTKGKLSTEDTNGNGRLDGDEDVNGNGSLDGDRRVITFYNNDPAVNATQICLNSSVIETGTCAASDYINTAVISVDLRNFDDYVWSANSQLQDINSVDISVNRLVNPTDGTWDFSSKRRYIFTWNDLNNDGIVDSGEDLPFESGMSTGLTVDSSRHGVLEDFNVASDTELDGLIEWLRGNNVYEGDLVPAGDDFTPYDITEDVNLNGVQDWVYRCRRYPDCDPVSNSPVWRLGDVIHSTPTLAARPAEGYHYIYSDPEYAQFYKKYRERRHVVYFGANDGMLHAVNAGFHIAGQNQFLPCKEDQRDGNNNCSGVYPDLGDELWAYVPSNLQPHLSCLSDQEYTHKYFVDAPPRIFDVRIFPDDAVHPNGWGTILVGYMRLGGAPLLADESVTPADNRKFISSYFVLDITDPERPPELLAEMTTTTDTEDYNTDGVVEDKYIDLGYTTSMPTMVAMRDDAGESEWFLILGNGPTTLKGENDQQGKLAVVPLNAITGVDKSGISSEKKPFRIPNTEPSSTTAYFGRFLIDEASSGEPSFVSDMVTVDFDIGAAGISGIGVPYKSDVVYFGTVDGAGFTVSAADPDKTVWGGGGRMYRLVTNTLSGDVEQYTAPSEWYLEKFLDAQAPITAAPNIGTDGANFWVYFGTGRFFAPEDKSDDTTQYFFGVKEVKDANCDFTWDEVNWWSDAVLAPIATSPASFAGERGLLQVDPIRVVESGTTSQFDTDYVYCEDDAGNPCTLPLTPLSDGDGAHTYYSFNDLENYIVGERCGDTVDTSIGIDGWYRKFNDPRERSLGMPNLLGGLLVYTSYQPFDDLCQAEGISNLYGVYYLTGTAWYRDVFGTYLNGDASGQKSIVRDRIGLGKGLATTPSLQVGSGSDGATAYIQTSTGEIVAIPNDPPLDNFKSGRKNWSDR